MKTIYTLILSITLFTASAQTSRLFTMTSGGGLEGVGTINSILSDGTDFQNVHSFVTDIPGAGICDQLLFYNGKIYGTSPNGGHHGYGVLFSYDTATSTYSRLLDFDDSMFGSYPLSRLILGPGNQIYGITNSGGLMNAGVIYRIDPTNDSVYTVAEVDSLAGFDCLSGLLYANDGNFYGSMSYGGTYETGTIFRYNPLTNVFTNLYSFDGLTNGAYPDGPLMQASDGLIYGTTIYGGTDSAGIIFSYDIQNGIFTKLYDLGGIMTGDNPHGGLVEVNQKLYGATENGTWIGYGAIFSYDLNTQFTSGRYQFSGSGMDNFSCRKHMIPGPNNLLYGAIIGSSYDRGKIFSYDPATNIYNDIYISHSFLTWSAVEFAGTTTLYGMGAYSSNFNLYKLDLTNNSLTVCLEFGLAHDGKVPDGGLYLASNHLLYGVTSKGGLHQAGVIITMDPVSGIFNKVYDLDSLEGVGADGTMKEGPGGQLYFTCPWGGANGLGTLLSFDINSNIVTKLADFGDSIIYPAVPTGSVTILSNGIFGCGRNGGVNFNNGCIWKYDFNNDSLTSRYSFNVSDGYLPMAGLIQWTDGKLYGTNTNGGNTLGTIFSFDPSNDQFAKLYDFSTSTGSFPQAEMTDGNDGYLYGTTYNGGLHSNGVLYRFDPVSNIYSDLFHFNNSVDGGQAMGKLLLAANGNLVGTTYYGGTFGNGIIYSYDRSHDSLIVLHNYQGFDGSSTTMSSLVEVDTLHTSVSTIDKFANKLFVSPDNTGNINLLIESESKGCSLFTVYNTEGKAITSEQVCFSAGISRHLLNLNSMAPGIYVIHAEGFGAKKFGWVGVR